MKNIKYIEIIFENCDSGQISNEMLSSFIMEDISDNIRLVANAVLTTRCCRTGVIRIDFKKNYAIYTEWNELLIKRVQSPDITSYNIFYTDETMDKIYVPWKGDDYINTLQEITVSDDNIITIFHKPYIT